MVIDDRAVRDRCGVEPGQLRFGLWFPRSTLPCRRCRQALEKPIGTSIGEALKLDDRLHHLKAGDGNLAAEKRPERKPEFEGPDPCHIGVGRAGYVGEAQVCRLDLGRGQDGDLERPVDRKRAPGDGLYALGDLRLESFPIEE